ncbi:MAG: GyrI-like domain-containing protein [Bacteroidales bacterium]
MKTKSCNDGQTGRRSGTPATGAGHAASTTTEYISRINRVFDYIETHIDQQLTLEELASVASFSKYHFHRIFYGIVGETPFQFILRLRLEKAAMLLLTQTDLGITEIAYKCGFTDPAIFSRAFKKFFGISASRYRREKLQNSNKSQTLRNKHQSSDGASMYFCRRSQTLKWKTTMELNKSTEVKTLPDMTVAYIRHIGPYKGDDKLFEKLWNRLFAWAGPRGLIGGEDFNSLVIYHDDPNLTDENKLRMSVCITVPPETRVDGEVGKMQVDGGKYVIARFEVGPQDFQTAWEWVFTEWFPASGYQPGDKPCFEMYPEEPKDGKFTVDICVPVKPL